MDSNPNNKIGSAAFWVAVSLALGAGIIFIGVPKFMKRHTASGNSCINNLFQIVNAKEQWALEHKKPPGHVVTPEEEKEVSQYMIRWPPICPSGGSYALGVIGSNPTCTIANHQINPPR